MDVLRTAIEKAGGFTAVAKLSGVSESHLYGVVNRHRPLTAKVMKRLQPHLKVSGRAWLVLLAVPVRETTDAA